MANDWTVIRIDGKLFQNLPEVALTRASAVMENVYMNEAGGHSRWPGLLRRFTIPDGGRCYLHEWRGDLMCGTSRGRLYRITKNGDVQDVTGVPISGGRRIVFSKTEDELVMAAGGPIVRLAGARTEILSSTAPLATHVQYVDGFLIANEVDSNRFFHNDITQGWRVWNPLDAFTAESKPDNLTCVLVTPYREILLGGLDSIEQFERFPDGDRPFFRRWAVGEGVWAPYTMVTGDNGTWVVNRDLEFVFFSNQTGQPQSDDIQRRLEGVDDWTDAWASRIAVSGHKFILLQIPFATNAYGTKGITYALDYRTKRFSELYGWDAAQNAPSRFPGWSTWQIGGTTYVGGEGVIYEFSDDAFDYGGELQRIRFRTGHYSNEGRLRIDGIRARVQRGEREVAGEPGKIRLRVRQNANRWTRWIERSLGARGDRHSMIDFGNFGEGHSHQIEYEVTSPVPFSITGLWRRETKIYT